MKCILVPILCILAILPGLRGAEDTTADDSTANTQAGGVTISPEQGAISPGDVITLTFPRPMVPVSSIDEGGQACPIQSQPKVDGTFLWKSQTEGQWTISTVVAGSKPHFILAPGLKDAEGKPFAVPEWNADFKTPEFSIETDSEAKAHLSSQPRIPITSTYDVKLDEVPAHAWVQDRDSRARLQVEIIQTTEGPPEAKEFQITPRDPLPPGRTYDLVIEDLQESGSRQPLPYPEVLPMGTTVPLEVEWLGGFNSAMDVPAICLKFNDSIPPENIKPGMVLVTPDVPDLEINEGEEDELRLTGDFDLEQRYHVSISKELRGERGYTLPAVSQWTARFPPRQPSLSFPGPQIYLRSRSKLHFAFMQSHTPAATWKLAAVPVAKLPMLSARLTEFNDTEKDPLTGESIVDQKTGEDQQKQTELLVDALKLPVVMTGTCPGAEADEDQLREVTQDVPDGKRLSGPYLIEASSKLADGRVAGGRALVFFSDYLVTQKRAPGKVFVRVASMSEAQPVEGITVLAIRADSIELDRAVTDARGMVVFPRQRLFGDPKHPATLYVAETPGGESIAPADGPTYAYGSMSGEYRPQWRGIVVTDRNLYRPGEEVKFKGMLRSAGRGALDVPPPGLIRWQVVQGDKDKVLGDGTAALTEDGGFDSSWKIPDSVALGKCTVKFTYADSGHGGEAAFDIEEYRVPLFSAEVKVATETGTTAHADVLSYFFHGGSNVGARVHWKAVWRTAGKGSNEYPQVGPVLSSNNSLSQTSEGDARIDAQGHAKISCDSPFAANAAVGISNVSWRADITSIDGQTITGGIDQIFSSSPVLLDVSAEEKTTAPRGITVKLSAEDPDGNPVNNPVPVKVELYQVTTRTVKEQVAPLVFKYHNTDEFAKVDTRDGMAPGTLDFSATTTGRYVVAVSGKGIRTPLVSAETTVTGEETAEMPVENETSFSLTTREEPWEPGDKAVFTVQAPFAGVAWVCVETDDILDTMVVPLSGNAARIEVPVKAEYAPNSVVTVYLTRPGGDSDLPAERFASAPLKVRRPDHELDLAPHLDRVEARPGQAIHGEVMATSEGKPVAGADLAVFAVDDAVLQLGGWTPPDLLPAFYPENPCNIASYGSLNGYIADIDPKGVFQKGFVIGDGGEEGATNVTNPRKEFRTLAFWQGSLKTGIDGKASFGFDAPDNLTTYRVVAVGQTKDSRFGGDAKTTVKISKPLLIDTALPRFLRDGDEVELRAVVRQSFADSALVTAKCIGGGGLALEGEQSLTGTVSRDGPWILKFKAKLNDRALEPVKVRFEAVAKSDAAMSDAVEITLPVSAPTITRREAEAGSFNGPHFDAATGMPADWKNGVGHYSVTLSTSSWLPAISGIPTILDYPHGCFEQITSKLLCYALLANLMEYLPDTQARLKEYAPIFQRGIAQIDSSLLPDNRLPYWPGESVGNDFVTCQACWALSVAAGAGFDIPAGLVSKLTEGAKQIATRAQDEDTRAFALFVLSQMNVQDDFSATAADVYLHRDTMGYDGRALLAMALHKLNIMPNETLQLMREIDKAVQPTAFKPATFGSMDRTEGIDAMAFETIVPPTFTPAKKAEVRKRMLHIMDSASILSTQENLWLLLAFKAMLDANPVAALTPAQPASDMVSKNGASAAWPARKLGDMLAVNGLNQAALTFLIQAEYHSTDVDTPRVDRGFRVERVVKDLTDSSRTGDAATPWKIGDQLLVTYRVYTKKQQYYVALEDSLPAALETVNPDLAQIGKFYEVPPVAPGDLLLDLSHSEKRDRSTLLYFDEMTPGSGVYSILTRVTAAGVFRWPATQVAPMYDSRFSGLSASGLCNVSSE